MKQQIRRDVFETNSSSVHAITLCSQAEFDAWKNGELWYDSWSEKLVTKEEKDADGPDERFLSYEDFMNWYDYETYSVTYDTPLGETIHAFGYYGHD